MVKKVLKQQFETEYKKIGINWHISVKSWA